jgi:hypothetical protein
MPISLSASSEVLIVFNSVTSTDANKLERIQPSPYRFSFSNVPYIYSVTLHKLGLHSLHKRRHLDERFLFRYIAA